MNMDLIINNYLIDIVNYKWKYLHLRDYLIWLYLD
jgi:hypothetical protein